MSSATWNRTSSHVNSSDTIIGYASTLLIPEEIVWLPYVGLIVTVALWLGYDFYKFHGRNRQRYVRIVEHMLVQRTAPTRRRINMISGVGLRFRHDISSCYSPLKHVPATYSREITPPQEGGDYFETAPLSNYILSSDMANSKVQDTEWRTWGDYPEATNDNKEEMRTDESQRRYGFISYPHSEEIKLKADISQSASASALTAPSTDSYPTIKQCCKVTVDDSNERGLSEDLAQHDASTQTYPTDFVQNTSLEKQFDSGECQGQVDSRAHQGHMSFYLQDMSVLTSAQHRDLEAKEDKVSREVSDHGGSSFTDPFSSHPSVEGELTHLRTVSGDHSDKRSGIQLSTLRLEAHTALNSPTELKDSKSPPSVKCIEVSHIHEEGGCSVPSNEAGPFYPPDMGEDHNQSPDMVIFKPSESKKSHPSDKDQPRPSHSHHKKLHKLNIGTPGCSPSRTLSPYKRTSQSLTLPPSYVRNAAPLRIVNDSSGEYFHSTAHPPLSAPIPSHLYHQDEEMFFSSVSSLSSSKVSMNEPDDPSKKGILFFSRFSGRGRNPEQREADRTGQPKTGGGGFSSGGFES